MARKRATYLLACIALPAINVLLFGDCIPSHQLSITSTEPPGRNASVHSALPADVTEQDEDETSVEEDVLAPGSYGSLRYHLSDMDTTFRWPSERHRTSALMRDTIPGLLLVAALVLMSRRARPEEEEGMVAQLRILNQGDVAPAVAGGQVQERAESPPPAYSDWKPRKTSLLSKLHLPE
uniref:Transmembrane protein n=1 Tax=Toxoplasma gondii (strain ATCC 50861 / VEG) TaxID=432359 RepID=A0A0F7V866_TOXGV|nr:TPA: hypothetical protein BN1205_060360 [Toxoplasma gondii VEG]